MKEKFKNSKFIQKIKALFKQKLFLVSLAIYLLIPIAGILIYNAENDFRTAGTYLCYENNVLTGKMILQKNNSIDIYLMDDIAKKDNEFTHKHLIVRWSYKSSSWSDTLPKDKYKYLSYEYILLEGDQSQSYVTFFIIGKKLYTSYLLDEERGGGQKCYQKS